MDLNAQNCRRHYRKALNKDDPKILQDYEIIYHKNLKLNSKPVNGPKIFKSLSDDDLDFMFLNLKKRVLKN
jgi:hypothetical protein